MTVIDFRHWDRKGWEEIGEVESSFNRGVMKLYAKQIEGVWYYALVHWLHQVSMGVMEFANGKVTRND